MVAAAGASWMALLAATTLGLSNIEHLRAEISTELSATAVGAEAARAYRLIVQSYAPESLEGELPGERARPLSSMQRSVTPDELRRGIGVDLVQIRDDGELVQRAAVVVAWVEEGQPDLEFDGMRARPGPDAVYGLARIQANGELSPARVVLRRPVV
jgi:hypothetical protein